MVLFRKNCCFNSLSFSLSPSPPVIYTFAACFYYNDEPALCLSLWLHIRDATVDVDGQALLSVVTPAILSQRVFTYVCTCLGAWIDVDIAENLACSSCSESTQHDTARDKLTDQVSAVSYDARR